MFVSKAKWSTVEAGQARLDAFSSLRENINKTMSTLGKDIEVGFAQNPEEAKKKLFDLFVERFKGMSSKDIESAINNHRAESKTEYDAM